MGLSGSGGNDELSEDLEIAPPWSNSVGLRGG